MTITHALVVCFNCMDEEGDVKWWYQDDPMTLYRSIETLPEWAVPLVATYSIVQTNDYTNFETDAVRIQVEPNQTVGDAPWRIRFWRNK